MQVEFDLMKYNRYAFLDPASGQVGGKKTASKSAIVCGVSDHVGRLFILESWAERTTSTAIIDKVLELNYRWQPKVFGVEAMATQTLLGQQIEQEARRRMQEISVAYVKQPTTKTKEERIRSAIDPVMQSGRLFIQQKDHLLLQELRQYPSGLTADLIDALASLISLIPPVALRKQSHREAEAVADYLRSIGAPPDVIKRRYAELRHR